MTPEERKQLFSDIYSRNRQKLTRFCRISSWDNQGNDLLQDVWTNIWNSLEHFRGECSADTWAVRVAVNTALMFRRSQGRQKRHLKPSAEVEKLAAREPLEPEFDEEVRKKLYYCVSRLQSRYRMVVSLHLEGMAYGQISEVIGISSSHVGVVLHRLKPILKKCITGEEE